MVLVKIDHNRNEQRSAEEMKDKGGIGDAVYG